MVGIFSVVGPIAHQKANEKQSGEKATLSRQAFDRKKEKLPALSACLFSGRAGNFPVCQVGVTGKVSPSREDLKGPIVVCLAAESSGN